MGQRLQGVRAKEGKTSFNSPNEDKLWHRESPADGDLAKLAPRSPSFQPGGCLRMGGGREP